MPYKGYVNVSTSMKKEDAEKLQIILKRYGHNSLHQFLKSLLIEDLNPRSTDSKAFTSKNNNIPNNDKEIVGMRYGPVAQYGSRHRPAKPGTVGSNPTGPVPICSKELGSGILIFS